MSDDPKISERYRDLPREEPTRALDDAILAASRRAVQSRPAPLVAPSGRRRWYVPVAAAAVITLAVAVTLHVQHDRPGEEVDAVSPSTKAQEAPKAGVLRQAPSGEARRDAARPGFTPDPKPAADGDVASLEKRSNADAPTRAPGPAQAPAPSTAPAEAPASAPAPAAQAGGARSEMARASVARTPEMELERIAGLRAAGRHEEADKALAEFRKRYPDYRLSEELKAKVEKRQ